MIASNLHGESYAEEQQGENHQKVSQQHAQKPTHWNFEYKRSGNAVSILLAGREILSISYFRQEFQTSIFDRYMENPVPIVTEEKLRDLRKALPGHPSRRETLKLLNDAYESSVQSHAQATASHIESNLVELATQVADMIFEEGKQNSGRLVSLQKNQIPKPVASPRLRDKILNRHIKGIRRRSGPTGQGRPEGSRSRSAKYSKQQLEAQVNQKIRELDSPTQANVASALGLSNGKALYRLQRAYDEIRPWKQIVREVLNN